jgi:hypothetical protein
MPIPDHDSIRAELEATRAAFHDLIASVSDEAWNRESVNAGWKVGWILMHVAMYLSALPGRLEAIQRGHTGPYRDKETIPFDIEKETRQSTAAKYDEAHQLALRLLDGIADEDWVKVLVLSEDFSQTPESLYRYHTEHFREHEAHVKASLAQ